MSADDTEPAATGERPPVTTEAAPEIDDAEHMRRLSVRLAVVGALAKEDRTAAAVCDAELLTMAAALEDSPIYAWLLARLGALAVRAGPWRMAIKARTGKARPLAALTSATNRHHFTRGDHKELAEALLRALGPDPLTFDAGDFWRYDRSRGVWDAIRDHKIRVVAGSFAGSPVGEDHDPLKIDLSDVRGAEALARDELLSRDDRVVFDATPAGIAFANGFVRVVTGRIVIVPHAPHHCARHGFAFAYEAWQPSLTPRFCEFLEQLFADCGEEERARRIALLQEYAGACLVGDATRYQKSLYLWGTGGNGKSALLTLLRAKFPPETLSSVPPQRWGERFGLAPLAGKLANFVSETPTAEILDGGMVKAVITGDVVTAERKNRDPFDFTPRAGHIFSTNDPIITRDHSRGFWRRVLILPLTRRFDDSPGRQLAPELEIIAHELAGLVAWAIEGAARAQRQHGYTVPDQSLRLLRDWQQLSNNVLFFLTTRPAGDVASAEPLYIAYREWAHTNGYKPVASNTFGERVKASGLYDVKKSGKVVYTRRVLEGPTDDD